MHASLTDRARWPWWLATMLVVVSVAAWWEPWRGDAAAPVPAPLSDIDHLSTSEVCTSSASASAAAPVDAAPVDAAPVDAAPVDAAPPAPAFKLEGVVIAGAGSFATLRRTTDARLVQLRVGDSVDGLTVSAIGLDRVVLAGAAGPVVIEAERRAAAAPVAAAIPAPQLIPIEQLPPAYRGPAPEDEVLGH